MAARLRANSRVAAATGMAGRKTRGLQNLGLRMSRSKTNRIPLAVMGRNVRVIASSVTVGRASAREQRSGIVYFLLACEEQRAASYH